MTSVAPDPQSGAPVARWATLADAETVAAFYAEAVGDEATQNWLLPDETRRREIARLASFQTYVHGLVRSGTLVVAGDPDLAGISVWIRSGGTETETDEGDPEEMAAMVHEVYGEHAERLGQVMALTEAAHPTGRPYLYLQQMAVLPTHRGKGLGGAMLRFGLQVADAEGLPAYLEASTPRNRALYLRHGFVDFGEPIQLPDGGPRLQPMLREPA